MLEDKGKAGGLSADLLNQHNTTNDEKTKPLERIVVRIEVSDTGCGIHEKEMHEIKLFSEFLTRSLWSGRADIAPQMRSIRLTLADNKGEKAPASGWHWFGRSLN